MDTRNLWLLIVSLLCGCASSAPPSAPKLMSLQSRAQAAPMGSIWRVPKDVGLAWSPPPPPDDVRAVAYNVYFGYQADLSDATEIPLGNVTNFTVVGLPSGYLHYFAVTDLDIQGEESDLSTIINFAPTLKLDMTFAFNQPVTNVSIQASTDLQQWSPIESTASNGVYRIEPNTNIPVEFFRAVAQSVVP